MSDLVRVEAAVAGLTELPPDEETADYVGRLDVVIRSLQGHRKAIMDELPGPVSGSNYRIVEERTCSRSYNTRALLDAFAGEGMTIYELIVSDVLRPDWQWSKVRSLANNLDVQLRIGGHELSAPEETDHVGEVWRSRYKVEVVK